MVNNNQENLIKVFEGKAYNIQIALSESKKELNKYFSKERNISKKDYIINEIYIPENSLYNHPSMIVTTEFDELKLITQRDYDILMKDWNMFIFNYDDTVSNLNTIMKLIYPNFGMNSSFQHTSFIRKLKSIRENETKELFKLFINHHWVKSSSMEKYLTNLYAYVNNKYMDDQYRKVISDSLNI